MGTCYIIIVITSIYESWLGFPGGAVVKKPPANQETQVWYLGQEDPLEWEVATHSSTLAWEIPWTVEPGRAMVHGVTRELDMT